MAGEQVLDDITVSGVDDAPAIAADVAVSDPAEDVEAVADSEESEATKAAKTLAAQRKKNDPAKDPVAKKLSIQAQIDADTRRKHDAKREADIEAARLETLRQERQRLERPEPRQEPVQQAPDFYTRPKPTVHEIGTKYSDWDAYNDDLQDWKLDERDAKKAHEAHNAAQQSYHRDVLTKADERIAAFKADHPDYDAVVNSAMIPRGAVSARAVIDHLNHSEFGAHLAYELGNDPAELARIASLPPGYAIAALGRLEAKIEMRTAAADAGPAPKTRAYTPAKPPIKPVGSSPVTSDDEGDPDDLSEAAVNAHIRRENAKDFQRRRR